MLKTGGKSGSFLGVSSFTPRNRRNRRFFQNGAEAFHRQKNPRKTERRGQIAHPAGRTATAETELRFPQGEGHSVMLSQDPILAMPFSEKIRLK